uniref:Protein TIC 214 n=1 Tax=Welwitschia mirabilis TaxID=3377 RepID=B7ZI01_WELMI|nr:hypothetical protein [Welwitschia mirabilis]
MVFLTTLTFAVGPGTLFALIFFLREGAAEGQFLMIGSFVGQFLVYLSIYYTPLYRLIMKPHLMSLLLFPYLFVRVYLRPFIESRQEIYLYTPYKKKMEEYLLQKNISSFLFFIKKKKISSFLFFMEGCIIQVLNPLVFGNTTLTRLINLLLFRYNYKIPFFICIILGWFVSYIFLIKLIKRVYLSLSAHPKAQKESVSRCHLVFSIVVFFYLGTTKIAISTYPWRTNLPLAHRIKESIDFSDRRKKLRKQIKEMEKGEKSEGKSSDPIEKERLKREEKELERDIKERRRKRREEKQLERDIKEWEQKGKELATDQTESKNEQIKIEQRKKQNFCISWKKLKFLEWPLFFFNYHRWTRRVFKRPHSDWIPFIKDRVSQYFFSPCYSDGNERLSFTMSPTKMFLEQKFQKTFSDNESSYKKFWINDFRTRNFSFWKEFRDRINLINNAEFIARYEESLGHKVKLTPIEIQEWVMAFERTVEKYMMQQAYKIFREKTIPWMLRKRRNLFIKKRASVIRKETLEKRVQLALPQGETFQFFDDPLLCGSSRVLMKYYKQVEKLARARIKIFREEYEYEKKKRTDERAIEDLWKIVQIKLKEKEEQDFELALEQKQKKEHKKKRKESKPSKSKTTERKRKTGVGLKILEKEQQNLTPDYLRLVAVDEEREKLDFYHTVKTKFFLRLEKEEQNLIQQFFNEEQQEKEQIEKNNEYFDLVDYSDQTEMKDKQHPLLDYLGIREDTVFRVPVLDCVDLSRIPESFGKRGRGSAQNLSPGLNLKDQLPWTPFILDKDRPFLNESLSTLEKPLQLQDFSNVLEEEKKNLKKFYIEKIIPETVFFNTFYTNFFFKLIYNYEQLNYQVFPYRYKYNLFEPTFFLFPEEISSEDLNFIRNRIFKHFEEIEWKVIITNLVKTIQQDFNSVLSFDKSNEIQKELPEWGSNLVEDIDYENKTNSSDFSPAPLKNVGYNDENPFLNEKQFEVHRHVVCNNRQYMFKEAFRCRRGKSTRPWKVNFRCFKKQRYAHFVLRMKEKPKENENFFRDFVRDFDKILMDFDIKKILRDFNIKILWNFLISKLQTLLEKITKFFTFKKDLEDMEEDFALFKRRQSWTRKVYHNLTKLDHRLYHKLRGPLLLALNFLRRRVVIPLLILIKNCGRFLLLQPVEFLEDFKGLSNEVHIYCTFDGLEFSLKTRPNKWLDDGFQIKILKPFRLEPWHNAFGTNYNLEDPYIYMSLGGEVDSPYGKSARKPSFWKPVLAEMERRSIKTVNSSFKIVDKIFLSKIRWIFQKRWVQFQIKRSESKMKKIQTQIEELRIQAQDQLEKAQDHLKKAQDLLEKAKNQLKFFGFWKVHIDFAKPLRVLTKKKNLTFQKSRKDHKDHHAWVIQLKKNLYRLQNRVLAKYQDFHYIRNNINKLKREISLFRLKKDFLVEYLEVKIKYQEFLSIQNEINKLRRELIGKLKRNLYGKNRVFTPGERELDVIKKREGIFGRLKTLLWSVFKTLKKPLRRFWLFCLKKPLRRFWLFCLKKPLRRFWLFCLQRLRRISRIISKILLFIYSKHLFRFFRLFRLRCQNLVIRSTKLFRLSRRRCQKFGLQLLRNIKTPYRFRKQKIKVIRLRYAIPCLRLLRRISRIIPKILLYSKHLFRLFRFRFKKHFVSKIYQTFFKYRKRVNRKFGLDHDKILSQAYVFHDIWQNATKNKPILKNFLQMKESYPFIKKKIRNFLNREGLLKYKEPQDLRVKDWKRWIKCYDRYDLSSELVWSYIAPKKFRFWVSKQWKKFPQKRVSLDDKLYNIPTSAFTSYKKNFFFKLNKRYRFNLLAYDYLDFRKTGFSQIFLDQRKTKGIGAFPVKESFLDFVLGYALGCRNNKKSQSSKIKDKIDKKLMTNDKLMTEFEGILDFHFVLDNNNEKEEDNLVAEQDNLENLENLEKLKLHNDFLESCFYSSQLGSPKSYEIPDSEIPDYEIPDSPDSEIPDSEIPDSEIPDSEIPDSEIPDSPDYEIPDSETPDSEIPDSETPDSEIPDSERPDSPDSEIPDSERPDSPDSETPDFGTPDFETPDFETPDSEIPGSNLPKQLPKKRKQKSLFYNSWFYLPERKIRRKKFKYLSSEERMLYDLNKRISKAFRFKKIRISQAKKKKLIQKKRILIKAERNGLDVRDKKESVEKELDILLEQEIQEKKRIKELLAQAQERKKEIEFNKFKKKDIKKIDKKMELRGGSEYYYWNKAKNQIKQNERENKKFRAENQDEKILSTQVQNRTISDEKQPVNKAGIEDNKVSIDVVLKGLEYERRKEHLEKLLDYIDDQRDDDLIEEEKAADELYILNDKNLKREIMFLEATDYPPFREIVKQFGLVHNKKKNKKERHENPREGLDFRRFYWKITKIPSDMYLLMLILKRGLDFHVRDYERVFLKSIDHSAAKLPTEKVLMRRLVNISLDLSKAKEERNLKALDKQVYNAFDFQMNNFLLEDVFLPRHRREFRILNRLVLEEGDPSEKEKYLNFHKKSRIKKRSWIKKFFHKNLRRIRNFFHKKSRKKKKKTKKLDPKKIIKRFIWPSFRLEDLLCMSRYWYNTTDGSRNSLIRLRMYPLQFI